MNKTFYRLLLLYQSLSNSEYILDKSYEDLIDRFNVDIKKLNKYVSHLNKIITKKKECS